MNTTKKSCPTCKGPTIYTVDRVGSALRMGFTCLAVSCGVQTENFGSLAVSR